LSNLFTVFDQISRSVITVIGGMATWFWWGKRWKC